MIAILSCTADDLYLFNLPFAVYSWHKIGVECMVFFPEADLYQHDDKIDLVIANCPTASFWPVACPKDKEATYMQCARLYAAALGHLDRAGILITSDADMCVFNPEFWDNFKFPPAFNVIGADLVPPGQVPMCYLSSDVSIWKNVMEIGLRTYQQCLDDLLGGIQAENFRGNYWGKDQETAYQQITKYDHGIQNNVYRSTNGNQFATRRADRDGWNVTPDIVDAHLPRPGHEPANMHKICELFEVMYPEDNFQWAVDYWKEYLKLMA